MLHKSRTWFTTRVDSPESLASMLVEQVSAMPDSGNNSQKMPENLSGEDVRHLMRKHKKTIKQLSFVLSITCKRIRDVRAKGLQDPLAVRDWLEHITGKDPGPIPETYRINRHTEEASCCYCGCPLYVGDTAFDYVGETFCSRTCCRKSRGWT